LNQALIFKRAVLRGRQPILPFLLCLVLFPAPVGRAQPAIAPAQDPLMSMMLSQPRIDLTSPVMPTVAFDPPVIAPGQQSIYRVTFNALEATIEWPGKIPAPAELNLEPGAHGEILRLGPAGFEPLSAFNTRVQASAPGDFTVPEFTVNVYGKPVTVAAARLVVRPSSAAPLQAPLRLLLELPATNLYVGQPIRARAILPGAPGGIVQGLAQVQLSGEGFLVDLGGARQRFEMAARNGTRSATYVYEATLTPMATGKVRVFAQGFTTAGFSSGPISILGNVPTPIGTPRYTLLESDPIELKVRPLPDEAEMAGFTGAIGRLSIGPPKLATNVVRVGDAVELTVAVTNRGDGPLARIVPPPAPRVRDWQVFKGTDVGLPQPTNPGPGDTQQGVTIFTYNLIPLSEQSQTTPAIPFSYFDPARSAYVDLTIPPVPVTVNPGSTPSESLALVQAVPAPEGEKDSRLSGLAPFPGRTVRSLVPAQQRPWFLLVQLLPAAAFIGLCLWDRRRRYLEQHPDVLRRRRARRALRRNWRTAREAAHARDASGFAAAAVNAMRVACAPHYPAEPRALVGSDVLALIPHTGGSGSPDQLVRRFFAVTDASQFATVVPDATELLALQPDLERVLQQLEARL